MHYFQSSALVEASVSDKNRKRASHVNHDLQVLRGISILSVFAFHVFSGKFANGYFGVDIFFFISGFLVLPKAADVRDSNQFAKFYKKRFLRIVPPLAVMLLTMAPLVLLFGSWSTHKTYLKFALFALLGVGNVGAYLINGDYFDSSKFLPLVHTWSLGVEIQVYLLAPLISKLKKQLLYFLFISSLTIYLIQFFSFNLENIIFYSPFARIWEFMLGSFAWKFNSMFRLGRLWRFILIALLLGLLLGPRISNWLLVILVFPLVYLYMHLPENVKIPKSMYLLHKLGDRSYSIYLYHMPLLFLAKYSPFFYGTDRHLETILAIPLILIISELSFRLIEGRFHDVK